MSTAEVTKNKETLWRLYDVFNSRDADLLSMTLDEFVEPDLLIPSPLPLEATGADAVKEVFRILRQAFPDLHITLEDVIAEGDKVVCRDTVTGTHLGEYMGLPPSGKPVMYSEIFIFRLVNGRVAETWSVIDVLSQMRQLGAIPGGV
jgi:steroid delta-isomerase-like uncharacterized protein